MADVNKADAAIDRFFEVNTEFAEFAADANNWNIFKHTGADLRTRNREAFRAAVLAVIAEG
jgi:hypothetical protein